MPSPYMTDLFDAMCADSRISIRVLYLEHAAPDTYWSGTTHREYARVVEGKYYDFLGARLHSNPEIVRVLEEDPGEITVVLGYAGFSQQRVFRWLTRNRQQWVFMGEIPGLKSRGWAGGCLRAIAQRPIHSASAIAAVGSRATTFYQRLVGDRIPVVNIPYVCDLTKFSRGSRPKVGRDVNFLFCGQIIHRKGVDYLLDAFEPVAMNFPNATLTLVGEGPLRRDLERLVPGKIANQVRFKGFQQPKDLHQHFLDADVFVMPSRHDGWGVVMNQALGSGLPVIATRSVGASHDLVHDKRNGFILDAEDTAGLTNAMEVFLNHPDLIEQFSRQSLLIAERVSPQSAVESWHSLFREVLSDAK